MTTATGPSTGKGAHRRADILAAARSAVMESGLDRFSMRALADSLDMKLGNLQYYFPTRDDLLEAVLLEQSDRELAALEPLRDAEPEAQLRAAIKAWAAQWTWGQGSVYMALRALAQHDERFAALARRMWSRVYDELVRMIRSVDPTCTAEEAQARAVLISSLVDGSSFQIYERRGAVSRTRLLPRFETIAVAIARGDAGSA